MVFCPNPFNSTPHDPQPSIWPLVRVDPTSTRSIALLLMTSTRSMIFSMQSIHQITNAQEHQRAAGTHAARPLYSRRQQRRGRGCSAQVFWRSIFTSGFSSELRALHCLPVRVGALRSGLEHSLITSILEGVASLLHPQWPRRPQRKPARPRCWVRCPCRSFCAQCRPPAD